MTSETKFNFRFGKGRRNQNESISADPAVKKRGPVSQPEDLDETQIQFVSIPGPSLPGKNFESYFSTQFQTNTDKKDSYFFVQNLEIPAIVL